MKKLLLPLLFVLFTTVGANAQDRCFKNDGLKVAQTVSFTIAGSKIAGTFVVSTYDGSEPDTTFEFSGTKTGSKLLVRFKGRVPYETAPKTKSIVWTLGAATLKIPVYGKNNTTNKYSVYNALYEQCGEM